MTRKRISEIISGNDDFTEESSEDMLMSEPSMRSHDMTEPVEDEHSKILERMETLEIGHKPVAGETEGQARMHDSPWHQSRTLVK